MVLIGFDLQSSLREKVFESLQRKKKSNDKRVRNMFQQKTRCDEDIMKEWINTEWSNLFTNPIRSKNILLADVHRAQQTDSVKALLTKKMTSKDVASLRTTWTNI